MRQCSILIVLTMLVAIGCGESVEVRQQKAQLALANRKPAEALKLADSVLEELPDDTETWNVKAKALLQLKQLDAAEGALAKVLELTPDDAKAHKLRLFWAHRYMERALSKSDFAKEEKWQKQYAAGLEVARNELTWLSENDLSSAEASFEKANIARFEHARMKRELEEQKLRFEMFAAEGNSDAGRIVAQMEGELEQLRDAIERHLRDAVTADPGFYPASIAYAKQLVEQNKWSQIWRQANDTANQESVPEQLADTLVSALLQMPEAQQAQQMRIATANKLLDAVEEKERKVLWRVSKARVLLTENKVKDALPILEEAAKLNKNDTDVRFLLARAYYHEQRYTEAESLLFRLAKEREHVSQIHTLHALVLKELGKRLDALEAVRKAMDANPNDLGAAQLMISLQAEEGNASSIERTVEEVVRAKPNDPTVLRMKLHIDKQANKRVNVKSLVERVARLEPLLDDHVMILIDGHMWLENYPEAEKYAEEYVRRNQNDVRGHLLLAEAAFMQNRDEQVLELLDDIKRKFPDQLEVNTLYARLLMKRRDYDAVIKRLEPVVEAQPEDVDARVLLARAYASLTLMDQAQTEIEAILEINPIHVEAHALAARLAFLRGDGEQASFHMAQIDKGQIDENRFPALLAQIKIAQGSIEEAKNICNRAITAGSRDPVLRLLLVNIYMKLEEPRLAEQQMIALIRDYPNNAQAWANLGRFYLARKELERGLSQLNELEHLNAPLAAIAEASMLAGAGKIDIATLKLQDILGTELQKKGELVLPMAEALGKIYVATKQPEKAIETYDRVIDAGVRVAEAKLKKIDLMHAQDGEDATLKRLDDLVKEVDRSETRLRKAIMDRYVALKRLDRALAIVDEWLKLDPDSTILLLWRGGMHRAMGERAKAIEDFRTAIEMEPESVRHYLRLADTQLEMLDYAAAEETYKRMGEIHAGAKIVALNRLGSMFLRIGLSKRSAEVFAQLEAMERSKDPRVLYSIGRANRETGNRDVAAARFLEIPEFSQLYAPAQIQLARIEQEQGKTEEARNRLKELLDDRRFAGAAVAEIARLNVLNARDEQLMEWSDKALNMASMSDSGKWLWLNVRRSLYIRQGNWEQLDETLGRMAQLAPDDRGVRAARLVVLIRRGEMDLARGLYRQLELSKTPAGAVFAIALAMEDPPKSADPLVGMLGSLCSPGSSIEELRQYAENIPVNPFVFRSDAMTTARRSDAMSPGNRKAALATVRAIAAMNVGIPSLAMDYLEEATKASRSFLPAYGVLVEARRRMANDARTVYGDVIRAVPGSSIALYCDAVRSHMDKKYDVAIARYQELLSREPEHAFVEYRLASSFQAAEKMDDAIKLLERIAGEEGPYKWAASNDVAYLLAVHRPSRLDDAFRFAVAAHANLSDNHAILDTIGWIEHLRGNHDKALGYMKRAVLGLGGLPELHYHMGMIYRAMGNQEWARYHLEEAASAEGDSDDIDRAREALTSLTAAR